MYIKICHVYIECTYICTLEVNLRPKCKRQIRKATRQKQKKKNLRNQRKAKCS
jgi:hypothetical protein